jgi:hypothetical protein
MNNKTHHTQWPTFISNSVVAARRLETELSAARSNDETPLEVPRIEKLLRTRDDLIQSLADAVSNTVQHIQDAEDRPQFDAGHFQRAFTLNQPQSIEPSLSDREALLTSLSFCTRHLDFEIQNKSRGFYALGTVNLLLQTGTAALEGEVQVSERAGIAKSWGAALIALDGFLENYKLQSAP